MRKFNNMYEYKSTAVKLITCNKLEQVKLKNFSTPKEFFVAFEKACHGYQAAGGTLDEDEKLRMMINALPPSHSYIADCIDFVPAAERTVEYVKQKIN